MFFRFRVAKVRVCHSEMLVAGGVLGVGPRLGVEEEGEMPVSKKSKPPTEVEDWFRWWECSGEEMLVML